MPDLKEEVLPPAEVSVKSFIEESLSTYNEKVKLQASFPPLDTKIHSYERQNGFVHAFLQSYSLHLPMELSPDDVWLTVCQGFCGHILANAEKMRKEFVDFDGKKELKAQLDDFVFGSPTNDWPSAFADFSQQIKDIIGKKMHSLFVHAFSTTKAIHTQVYEATLLSAMQKYFAYTVCTACGIPRIRMRGTPQDWHTLREKVAGLAKFDLEWWISKLLPIIDKFVAAAVEGEQDPDFWNSVGKIVSPGESGDFVGLNGWVGNFFPYINSKPNEKLRDLAEILETMKTFNPDDLEYEYEEEDEDES